VLTVLFSTHNGATTLPTMLEAMCTLEEPEGGYHIVAVLNACTDNSREILERYLHRLPLTLVEEPRCGKNHALNRGLAEARGELLVFSDDDVVPLKTWLVAYERMARERPDFDIFGGRILPYWMAEPPSWVLERVPMGLVFAVHPADLAGGEIHHGMIWGPNMMVRSRVFAAGYRFNGNVGPDGTNTYAMGSESEFLERLSAAGYRSWFCGECAVQHMIRPWQLKTEWIVGRAFRYGRFRYDHGERKQRRQRAHSGAACQGVWHGFVVDHNER